MRCAVAIDFLSKFVKFWKLGVIDESLQSLCSKLNDTQTTTTTTVNWIRNFQFHSYQLAKPIAISIGAFEINFTEKFDV